MIKPRQNLRERTILRLEKVKELYQSGLTVAEISDLIGIPKTTIWYTLEVGKIVKRKAKIRNTIRLNKHAFDSVDSAEVAYWLGFLYADGSTTRYTIIITLSTKDEAHLTKFLSFTESDVSIRRWNRTPLSPMSTITISSVYLATRLRELGIIQKRTNLKSTIDHLPLKYYRDFIRGYFDGDGYVSKNVKTPFIGLTGRQDIITWIENVLSKELSLKSKLPRMHKGSYELRYDGKNTVNLISHWMYENSETFLDRKYNLSLQWINQ